MSLADHRAAQDADYQRRREAAIRAEVAALCERDHAAAKEAMRAEIAALREQVRHLLAILASVRD